MVVRKNTKGTVAVPIERSGEREETAKTKNPQRRNNAWRPRRNLKFLVIAPGFSSRPNHDYSVLNKSLKMSQDPSRFPKRACLPLRPTIFVGAGGGIRTHEGLRHRVLSPRRARSSCPLPI